MIKLYPKAIEYCKEAIHLNINDEEVHIILGDAYRYSN